MKRETILFTLVALCMVSIMITLFVLVQSADSEKLLEQRWTIHKEQNDSLDLTKKETSKQLYREVGFSR